MCYNIVAGRSTLYTYLTELTFKRHVMSSGVGGRGPVEGPLFLYLGGIHGYLRLR